MIRSLAIASREAAKTKYVVEYLIGPQAWKPQLRSFEVPTASEACAALLRQYSTAIVIRVFEPVAAAPQHPGDDQ